MQPNYLIEPNNVTQFPKNPNVTSALRVVILGEGKAGKSALINAVARGVVITQPSEGEGPVTLRHGVARAAHDISHDLAHLQDIEFTEIACDHERPLTPPEQDMIAGADLIIWVTIASQAWRLSEQVICDRLRESVSCPMILAVSRADKLRSQTDIEKIAGRLHRDTGGRFEDIVFISASPAAIEASATDAHAWKATAGQKLHGLLMRATKIKLREAPRARPVSTWIDDLTQKLERVSARLQRLVVTGVILHETGQVISPQQGHPDLMKLSQMCGLWSEAQARLAERQGAERSDILSEVSMEGYYLIHHTDRHRQRTVFLFCGADLQTRILARTLFMPISKAA